MPINVNEISTQQQFIDELIYITYSEASSKSLTLSTDECFSLAKRIVLTNYSKCLSKFFNGESWSL